MKTIYKGKLISFFEQKVKLPNGYLASLEVIKHPGASLIIPFLSKDKIILLKQFRPVINTYLYELPAGTLKKGEPALSCARRELIEETKFSAKKFTMLGYIFPVPGYSTEKIVIFKAEGLEPRTGLMEEDEVIETIIVSKSQLKKLLKSGKLHDAKTLSALVLAGWLC